MDAPATSLERHERGIHIDRCGGERNVEVLTELGLTPAQIAALEEAAAWSGPSGGR